MLPHGDFIISVIFFTEEVKKERRPLVSLSIKRGNSKQLQKDKDELKEKLQKLEKDYDDLAKEKTQLETDIDDLRRKPIVPEILAPVKAMVVAKVVFTNSSCNIQIHVCHCITRATATFIMYITEIYRKLIVV